MTSYFLLIFLTLLGSALGSYACCTTRRLRRQEKNLPSLPSRSTCENCGYRIRWFDNIPILSYFLLKGRCRKCHKKIGKLEPASEIIMTLIFFILGLCTIFYPNFFSPSQKPAHPNIIKSFNTFSYHETYNPKTPKTLHPISIIYQNYSSGDINSKILTTIFVILFIIFLTLLLISALYDAKWHLAPTKILILLILTSLPLFIIKTLLSPSIPPATLFLNLSLAIAILSGTYFLLYKLSKETAVGGGDWLVGLALALVLSSPIPAFLNLLFANLTGSLVMSPKYFKHKKSQKSFKIPMIPFFFAGFIITLILIELPLIQAHFYLF